MQGIRIVTGKELLAKEFPPTEYLAQGLIASGTTLLCGDPKVGKSLVALQLALCITEGSILFGNYESQIRGKVLYFCLEDGQKRLNKRMKELDVEDEWADNLLIVNKAPRLGQGFEDVLESILTDDPDIMLVIIDPLVQIRPISGGNSPYREDYAAIQSVRTILEAHGVSGLIVHHLRKEHGTGETSPLARISGTQGLAGAADHIFIMAGVRGKKAATLHRISRDDDELAIGLEREGVLWNLAGDAVSVTLSPALRPVYDCVATSEKPIGPTEIARIIGKSKGTVGEQCKTLMKGGVFDEFDGKYALAS
nr:AAA family ATPase [Fundidesulfovibrio terrae]